MSENIDKINKRNEEEIFKKMCELSSLFKESKLLAKVNVRVDKNTLASFEIKGVKKDGKKAEHTNEGETEVFI